MYYSIRKKIVTNLLAASLIIACLTGLTTVFIELQRIDSQVGRIAITDADRYITFYHAYYQNPTDSAFEKLRNQIQADLSPDKFIQIEIYDENEKILLNEFIPEIDKVLSEFNRIKYQFPMKETVEYKKFLYKDQLYIKIMVHLISEKEQTIIGHFEGIYHISHDRLAEIKKQMMMSIGQSIIIVFMTTLFLYPIILLLNKRLLQKTDELLEANISTLKSLGSAIAKRDSDTNAHNYRVTIFAICLAEEMGFEKTAIRSLIKGSFLHDIGKIGISDTILLKPGKLTSDEFDLMKMHVTYGLEIIKNNLWLREAQDVVQYHHEKFNGTGYMKGMKGEEIPITARVFAIADVFDALTSTRPYKEAFSFEKAISIIREGDGEHFDPGLLKVFEQIAPKLYHDISGQEKELLLSERVENMIKKYFKVF